MAPGKILLVAGTFALMVLSGCVSSTDGGTPMDEGMQGHDGHDHVHEAAGTMMHDNLLMVEDAYQYDYSGIESEMVMDDFKIQAKNCREGGGVSVYESQPGSEMAAPPLLNGNNYPFVGEPNIGTYGQPIMGDFTDGIWHITTVCESYTYNGQERGELTMGWVGVLIEPPPWDDSGIETQFFITDVSFADGDAVDDLKAGAMLHASRMLEGKLDITQDLFMHQVLDDEDHGIFQTHSPLKPYGTFDVDRMRFWLYVDMTGNFNLGHAHGEAESPGHESHMEGFRPIAIDMVNSGGGEHLVSPDGTGFLSHTRTDHHGATGGAAGNLAGVLFRGFDREITVGPSPPIVLEETWLH